MKKEETVKLKIIHWNDLYRIFIQQQNEKEFVDT